MKKNKYSVNDFNETDLPRTRKEQFFDILKTNYRVIFYIGLILFLMFIPLLVVFFLKNSSLYNYVEERNVPYISSTILIFDSIQIIFIIIIFVGLGGILQVLKVLSWNDGLFFKDDFLKGIKLNWKRFAIHGFAFGICCMAVDLGYYVLDNNLIFFTLFGLIQFILFPALLFLIEFDAFFSNKFFVSLSNSFRTMISYFLISLVFSAIACASIFVSFIPNYIIVAIVYALLIVFVMPLYLLAFHQICFKIFDEKLLDNFIDIKCKGLHIEKNIQDKGENSNE